VKEPKTNPVLKQRVTLFTFRYYTVNVPKSIAPAFSPGLSPMLYLGDELMRTMNEATPVSIPQALKPVCAVIPENIPYDLKALCQWFVWKYMMTPGRKKPSKPPIDANKPISFKTPDETEYSFAKTNDPATLCGYETALSVYQAHEQLCGISFSFIEGDGITGIDLDHVRNKETGEITREGQIVLDMFKAKTYCEISPSGEGIRIFCKGTPKRSGKCKGEFKWLEIYAHPSSRHLTVTGHQIEGTPRTLAPMQEELDQLHTLFMEKEDKPNTNERRLGGRNKHERLTDEQALEKILNSRNSTKFEKLWIGDDSDYGNDTSSGDLAFCNQLAWITTDPDQIDRIYCNSQRYREKWTSPRGNSTYGMDTIQKAIEGRREREEQNPQEEEGEDDRPRLRPTTANAVDLATANDLLNAAIAYNELTGTIEKRKPLPYIGGEVGAWQSHDTLELLLLLSQTPNLTNEFKKHIIDDAVAIVANRNRYNPAIDRLNEYAKNWDGKPRLSTWLVDILNAEQTPDNETYLRELGYRWLIGVIARIMQPGCQRDECLVLVGNQGCGKSNFAKTLAEAIAPDAYSDSLTEMDSEEAMRKLRGLIICELSELSAMRRGEIEGVKRFLSAKSDYFRKPYSIHPEHHKRTVSFVATTNELDGFLKDSTGNRRLWPVVIQGVIDRDRLATELPQLLGEACKRFKAGEAWHVADALALEQAETVRDQHREIDPMESKVLERVETPNSTTEAIIFDCFQVPPSMMTPAMKFRTQKILRANGWTTKQVMTGNTRRYVWVKKNPE